MSAPFSSGHQLLLAILGLEMKSLPSSSHGLLLCDSVSHPLLIRTLVIGFRATLTQYELISILPLIASVRTLFPNMVQVDMNFEGTNQLLRVLELRFHSAF